MSVTLTCSALTTRRCGGPGWSVTSSIPKTTRYRVVFATGAYLISDEGAQALRGYVEAGGNVVMSFGGGMVDSSHHARSGGYPCELRDVFGIRVEEFRPLPPAGTVALTGGDHGTVWSEELRCEGAEVLASYAEGVLAGHPAVTRNSFGGGPRV
jgi:beta-galactosidase